MNLLQNFVRYEHLIATTDRCVKDRSRLRKNENTKWARPLSGVCVKSSQANQVNILTSKLRSKLDIPYRTKQCRNIGQKFDKGIREVFAFLKQSRQ